MLARFPIIQAESPFLARYIIAVLVTSCVLLASSLFGGLPIFETNDDAFMRLIVEGIAVCDKPDWHIYHITFPVGITLSWLFSRFPEIPWYGLLLGSFQILALSAIVAVLTRKLTGGLFLVFSALIAILFGTRVFHLLQFTTTAALCGAGALLLFLEPVLSSSETRKDADRLYSWLLATLLFSIACTIRTQTGGLILVLFFVFSLCLFSLQRRFNSLFVSAIACLAGIGILGIIEFSNNALNQQGGWQETRKTNYLRQVLVDYGRLDLQALCLPSTKKKTLRKKEKLLGLFADIEWKPVDAKMLYCWYLEDENIFSREKLQFLVDNCPKIRSDLSVAYLKDRLDEAVMQATVIFLAIFGFIALFVYKAEKHSMIFRLIWPFSIMLLLVVLLVSFKLQPRVLLSIMLIYGALTLSLFPWSSIETLQGRRRKTCLIAVSVLAVLLNFALWSTIEPVKSKVAHRLLGFKTSLARLDRNPEILYVCWGNSFPIRLLGPYENASRILGPMRIVWLGANARSPRISGTLKSRGIENLVCSLDRDDVLIVSSPAYNQTISEFLKARYSVNAEFEAINNEAFIPLRIYRVRFRSET